MNECEGHMFKLILISRPLLGVNALLLILL